MKLIYTCDTVNEKKVTPYTAVADFKEIIGRPTSLSGEQGYGLVYRISVPLNTQYVNKSGISFVRTDSIGGNVIAKPYGEIVKVTEFIEWKSYMSFYDKLVDVINDDRLANKSWCKKVDGELVIDIRDSVYEPWHYENWYANKRYTNGERIFQPKRCSIKTIVSNVEE